MQRVKGQLRTTDADYLAATDNYISNVAHIIAQAQITNGGSIILYQPENEYSWWLPPHLPDGGYMQYVEDQARKAGIVVPIISNDAAPLGHNAPGSGSGAVDIYGHDDYPLKFDCSNPSSWPKGALNGAYHLIHKAQSPSTPFSLLEFQGGAFDPWGGPGFENCTSLLNEEFERVFYKNNLAARVTIQNIYMIYGGTNWGNIGHPGGYSSYDYGAPIKEDLTITREKYAELKLIAEWLKVSPGYLTADPGPAEILTYCSNPAITITRLEGAKAEKGGSFFIIRHSDYSSTSSTSYTLSLPTSKGKVSIPALYGSLTLNGRDSKIVVTDYNSSGYTLLYSTAEILTHQKYNDKTVLVVYTGPGETNELAIKTPHVPRIIAGDSVAIHHDTDVAILTWATSSSRKVIKVNELYIYAIGKNKHSYHASWLANNELDRYSAHNYWIPPIAKSSAIIVNGPYLIRNASICSGVISISADFDKTTIVEVIAAPQNITAILINGIEREFDVKGVDLSLQVPYEVPKIETTDLAGLDWNSLNSLPELNSDYDDALWTVANRPTSNSYERLRTPTSLFASDYGFNTGVILFRGHFTAKGTEKSFSVHTQGGTAYGHSVWLNDTFIGSWRGDSSSNSRTTYQVPDLLAGKPYVLTVVIDHMGFDENPIVGRDAGKAARGILQYSLSSSWFQSTPVE